MTANSPARPRGPARMRCRTDYTLIPVLLAVLLAAMPLRLHTEDTSKVGPDGLETVTIENGTVARQYLPYGRVFRLVGSIARLPKPADLVQIEIFQGSNATGTPDTYIWERTADSNTQFSVIVDQPLKLGQKYTIQVQFFSRFSFTKDQNAVIVARTIRELTARFVANKTLTNTEVHQAVQEQVSKVIQALGPNAPPIQLNVDQMNRKVIVTSTTGASIPAAAVTGTDEFISETVGLTSDITEKSKEIRDQRSDIDIIWRSPEFDALKKHLAAALEVAGNVLKYKPVDITDLESTVPANDLPPGLLELREQFRKAPSTVPSVINQKDIDLLDNLKDKRQGIRYKEAELKGYMEADAANRAALDAAIITIVNSYTVSLAASSTMYSFASKSELDAINVGTNYGVAAAAMHSGADWGASFFQYAGLTVHLGSVDKELPNPWLDDGLSRWSVLIGFAIKGPANFNGRTLDPIGGLYPYLGINYALDRYVTLDLGALLFENASTSPLKKGHEANVAPALGVSLDFDVFNQIRKLIE